MSVVFFILLIGPLVFVHELGHFLVAKVFNIYVTKFSLGFGPVMIGRKWGETFYQIAWVPLGGFVKFLGDDPSEKLPDGADGRTFTAAAVWKRALVVGAGPGMSLALPLLCYFVVGLLIDELRPATVGQVFPDTPAASAGLQPGDRILSIDGRAVHAFVDLQRTVNDAPEQQLTIEVERDGSRRTVEVRPARLRVPRFLPLDIWEEVGRIGISNYYPRPVVGVLGSESPAGRAGLRDFDLITKVDDRPVRRWLDLERELEKAPAGEAISLAYLRPERLDWPFADVYLLQPGQAELAAERDGPGASGTGLDLAALYVSHVREGFPGDRAGIQVGDEIVSVDGRPITLWEELVERLQEAPDQPHAVALLRDGESLTVELAPEQITRNDRYAGEVQEYRAPGIGVYRVAHIDDPVPNPNRLGRAFFTAFVATRDTLELTLVGLLRLVQGRVSVQSIGGPFMLFDIAAQAGRRGLDEFLSALALISVNLGLINLLPVPVLDGGHLVLLSAEAIRRKPLGTRAREVANLVGLVLLLLLMAMAIVNDVRRYWDWEDVTALFQ